MTEMTLAEYQQAALTTALPTAFDNRYLIPGMVSELGEVFGKLAKAHRDRWAETKPAGFLENELVKEYGDICWAVAVHLHHNGVSEISEDVMTDYNGTPDYAFPLDREGALSSLLGQSFLVTSSIYESKPRQVEIDSVQFLWLLLRRLAVTVTGSSFDHVLGVNIAKLNKRKINGTLEGSGDDR